MSERTPAGAARDGSSSLPETIAASYGPGIDPRITLQLLDAAAAPDDLPGHCSTEVLTRLASDGSGRYRIQGEVARGGQGTILRVWDEQLRRQLAMKVSLGRATASGASAPLPGAEAGAAVPGSASQPPPADARSVGRFLEEAQVTSQLDHPGIVPVHELGLDDQGRIFFTMKLVRGEDLRSVFAKVAAGSETWTVTRALSVLLRVCEAMSYAHARQVIHRDLKPGNIMVGGYGEVFVMDWGLARVLGRPDGKDLRVRMQAASNPDSPLVTMDGDAVGTPAYMSPEQASGRLDLMGPPSDVYALGAMLYQLLTGRLPYVTPGETASNYDVLSAVQQGPPASVTSLAPRAQAELVAICEQAMARDPADRYPDMSALAEDLRAYLEHRVVAAYETGAVAELRKWVGRNRPLAAALAAGVLALAGGLTASLVFKSRSDRNAALAQQNEEQATRKANEVLSLSAIQELKELVDRADALWPAAPERVADLDGWLATARVLVDGSATHPGLKDHAAKLAELRQRARPLTREQVEQDRRANPRYGEWEQARDELTWMRRMLGEEAWPSEDSVEAELANEQLPATGDELNHLAWILVDPQAKEPTYGGELRALLLVRRAIATDAPTDFPEQRDTHAWTLYRCGRLDEALAEEQQAVQLATGTLKPKVEASQQRLQQQVARWREAERPHRVEDALQLAARIAALEPALAERRTFEFDDPQDGWWHAQLAGLVTDLEAFADERTGLDSAGLSPQRGWGIARRAEFARTIDERSVSGATARARWAEAGTAIESSPLYDGLTLSPQRGLLPLGPDPDSGLWEFCHLASGDEPHRDADGRLVLTGSSGIVLVLIPGGPFWMGAQADDPAGRNYDPQADTDESPTHEVTLSPYLISKYELTKGQWQGFTGGDPSEYRVGVTSAKRAVTLLCPVEQVTWEEARDALERMQLELPTEAQWERAARAGVDTPWSTGRERETLIGAANLADRTAASVGAPASLFDEWPEFEDGWALYAPVGSFRPNAFGLHDVHGNVSEWCRDGYDAKYYKVSPAQDPCRSAAGRRNATVRSSSYYFSASHARSASRSGMPIDNRSSQIGVRPVRAINP